MAKETHKCV